MILKPILRVSKQVILRVSKQVILKGKQAHGEVQVVFTQKIQCARCLVLLAGRKHYGLQLRLQKSFP